MTTKQKHAWHAALFTIMGALAVVSETLSSNPIYSHAPAVIALGILMNWWRSTAGKVEMDDGPGMPPHPPSKLPVIIAFAFLLPSLAGCPKPGPAPSGPTPVQTFEECTNDVVKGRAVALIGLVAQATLGPNSNAALTALAVQYGWPEVKCAAELFIATLSRKAAIDENAALQKARAGKWLQEVETAPSGGDGGGG